MKRLYILLTLLLLSGILMMACNSDMPPSPDTTADVVVTAEPAEAIDIVKDGVANYRVIRAEKADQTTVDATVRIREQIREETGTKLEISTDWVKRGAELDHSTLEILVGSTAYEESARALEGVPYGDYIITRVDNKIVINAWSEVGLLSAVTAFNRAVSDNAADCSLSLPADIRLTDTVRDIVNALPMYEGGSFRTIYTVGSQANTVGSQAHMVIIDDTDPDAYAAYRQALESAGYTLYTENNVCDNRFTTYISDQYVINAGYYPYETAARIIIEPRITLPALKADNQYQTRVDPNFAMLGLEFEHNGTLLQNGQCFIFQLADGSYIIVDGGFSLNRDAKAIYDYMRDHAPDPSNITIAAWIITHAHGDHHGAFATFSKNYASQVTLELVIGNFPSDEALLADGSSTRTGTASALINYVKNYKGASFINTHVGHKFYLRDAEIEILYTYESYVPNLLTYFNTTSLIFTVDLGGQRFLVTGDASEDAFRITNAMYGDYLKSDFVQAAHHGGDTGSSGRDHAYANVAQGYTLAAAPVVLWPLGDEAFAARGTLRPASATLYDLPTTKEIFVAGSRDVRFTLPYTYGTSGCPSILK